MKKTLTIMVILLIGIFISYAILDKFIALKMSTISNEIRDVFSIITMFGSPLLIVACIGMLIRYLVQTKLLKKSTKSQLLYLFVPITVISSWGISHFFKFVFGRIRPSLFVNEKLYGFTFFNINHDMTSFPSGHTVLITSFLLSILIFKPRLKWLFFILISLIAGSRIILNKHYLSDILFGLIIGILMVELFKKLVIRNGIRTITDANTRG